jgi:hypothetical protein
VQELELFRRDVGTPLVDLGVGGRGRVDDGGRRSRFVCDPNEVVEDRLAGELLDDPRAGAAPGEPGRDNGDVESLERSGDVDALAAGESEPAACPVTLAALEVGHAQSPVERRVHRHRDNHENQPPMFLTVSPAYHPARPKGPGFDTERLATSGDLATIRLPS